jgi:hypothetical protein
LCDGSRCSRLFPFLYERGVLSEVLIRNPNGGAEGSLNLERTSAEMQNSVGSPRHDPMLVDRAVSRKQLIPLHRCSECHFWEPLDVMSSLGECENHESHYYRKAVMRNTESPNCFKPRDLGESEFLWCESCKQTVSDNELKAHAGHSIFIGTVQFPVEDNIEWTHAAD